jgi:hypothetical protein
MRKVVAAVLASVGVVLMVAVNAPTADAGDYGKCSFASDCHAGVKCNGGKCADSAGSSCNFDSDCGGGGAKCNSGKCSNAPDGKCNFDSECPGGKCSGGKCGH